jgi:hypothetical protein
METCQSRADAGGRGIRAATLLVATAGLTVQAHAGSFTIGEDTKVDYVVTTGYGLNIRAERPNESLAGVGNLNGNDGDRNFKRGAAVNNRVSVIGEADINRNGYGLFIRGSTFHDFAYRGTNDNNSPETINKFGPVNEFTSDARHYSGQRTRLLDAYIYGGFDLGGQRKLDLRLGNQVVAWGESLYLSGISAVQGPVDATKANVPGTEVKDILLPERQASASLALTRDWSLLGYYQFRHHPYELSPVGDYFSTTDVVGPGAEFIRLAPGDAATAAKLVRGADIRARNRGQWGLGTRYLLTANTQLGLYYLRYHDRIPSVVINADGTYNVKYFEDIKLTGASISTRLGDWQVSGELSYKQDAPMLTKNAGAQRGNVTQAQVSFIKTWGQTWIASQASLSGEVGYQHVNKVAGGVENLTNDRNSWAYQVGATLTYPNVFSGWDMDIPLSYGHQYSTAAVSYSPFTGAGDHRASVGVRFKYLGNMEIGLTYNAFLGSPDPTYRALADRNFVALSAKYSF